MSDTAIMLGSRGAGSSGGSAGSFTTLGSTGAATLDTGGAGSSFGGALGVSGKLTTSGTLAVAGGESCANISSSSWANLGSSTISAGVWFVLNTNQSTIASYTLTMPAAPGTGQIVNIVTAGIVSAFTLSPNGGQTIINAPTALTAGIAISFIFTGTIWYRIQ